MGASIITQSRVLPRHHPYRGWSPCPLRCWCPAPPSAARQSVSTGSRMDTGYRSVHTGRMPKASWRERDNNLKNKHKSINFICMHLLTYLCKLRYPCLKGTKVTIYLNKQIIFHSWVLNHISRPRVSLPVMSTSERDVHHKVNWAAVGWNWIKKHITAQLYHMAPFGV